MYAYSVRVDRFICVSVDRHVAKNILALWQTNTISLTFHCLLYYLIGIKLLLLEDIGGYIDGLLDKHVRPFMLNTIYAYEHSILTPR